MTYQAQYMAYQKALEAALAQAMERCQAPEPMMGAMRYSLLAGGKRVRPIALLAACEAGGGSLERAMPYAVAMEMIHTYSLIHDDLPALDNDDMRRGRPTNHKVFGEGMAVFAGDALLSLAFEVMLDSARDEVDIQAMRRIARAAGACGMMAGQCVDLVCEQNGVGGADELVYIDLHKTADLFIGSVTAGLILADADAETVVAGERFAEAVGTAFQIRDDLLDIEGNAASIGKATGKDAARGKLTWPKLFGVDAAKHAVREKTDAAMAALDILGERADFLRELALQLLERDR